MDFQDKIREEEEEIKSFAKRILKRDFHGNTKEAINNSSWQFSTTVLAKLGSILFTIILARILLPEIYGLYGLALSTILLFSAFSDLGVGNTFVTFVSKKLVSDKAKAKGYAIYLTKIKFVLVLLTALILIIFSKYVSNYYDKPIFLALIAGGAYILLFNIGGFVNNYFIVENKFQYSFLKEFIFQSARLIFVPLVVLLLITKVKVDWMLFGIILTLGFCYLISGIPLFFKLGKTSYLKEKEKNLEIKEKKEAYKFVIPLTLLSLSSLFGSIDIIMLGKYVSSSNLGFYQLSLSLLGSVTAILGFASAALLPIFAKVKNEQLERALRKTRLGIFGLSVLAMICTIILAEFVINFIYGNQYFGASFFLKYLAVLILIDPIIGIYNTYYTSKKQTKVLFIFSTTAMILNVIFNFIFIHIGISYSEQFAILGAASASILSRGFHLFGLGVYKKWKN